MSKLTEMETTMKQFLYAVLLTLAAGAQAQQHPLFKDADLKAGEKLIAEN